MYCGVLNFFFCKDNTNYTVYLIFCVSNFRKVGIFAAFSERQKVKSVSASRGFVPYPSDHGLYPWIVLGAAPPDPRL